MLVNNVGVSAQHDALASQRLNTNHSTWGLRFLKLADCKQPRRRPCVSLCHFHSAGSFCLCFSVWCCSFAASRSLQPFHNPAESYRYYSLPYCTPKDDVQPDKHSGLTSTDNLGEVLAGDRRRRSMYDIRFGVDIQWTALCQFTLTQDDIRQFTDAIRQHYIFEMFVDDLPVKGFVGEMEENSAQFDHHIHNTTHIYLFTHLDFSIAYNGDHVIAVNLTTDPQQRVEIEYGKDVS